MKECLDCGALLSLDYFPKARKRSDGRGSYCKACMLKRSRASYRKRMAAQGKSVRQPEALPEGLRRCADCTVVKPENEFPPAPNKASGRHTYCRPCNNARSRESRQRLYGGSAEYHRRARYGLEAGEFNEILLDQGDLCALCGEQPAAHVDHCHEKGHVRGILCFNCNGGLGQFRDRVDILKKAIDYLERTRDPLWLSLDSTDDSPLPLRLRGAAVSPTSSEESPPSC